jgi:putative transposase
MTLKYCPQWPTKGFSTLENARKWMLKFEQFYNHEHRHSGIRYVTPSERHGLKDVALLGQRKVVYELAKSKYPERWSGRQTRNWTPVGAVSLNPDREIVPVQAVA